ncbi:MAG: S1/P1 nuclease, partial [Legionella sp.]|nr:S1/P1 nuclease [Legionella sp.]
MQRFLVLLFVLLISINSYAWNAVGHRLVAQIAYDNLTPASKAFCDKYSKGYGKSSIHSNFVAGASWLDAIRRKDIHWYDALHYIDIPFSDDKSKLPPVPQINALWGINQAIAVLSSKKSSTSDKKLSL